jgi:2-haloacid dehalogenase
MVAIYIISSPMAITARRHRHNASETKTRMTQPRPAGRAIVVFDLGGVLIDWNPRYLYRTLFDDEAEMEAFLSEVTTQEWNAQQDAGRPWSEAVEELAALHPGRRELIEAYWKRWPETLGGPIEGTVSILGELRARGVRTYALSNWSAETFPLARPRFPFLEWFDGILVSGDVKLAKPDPRIFAAMLQKFGLNAASTVFIDDSAANVRAAEAAGLIAIRFQAPQELRRELAALDLLSG